MVFLQDKGVDMFDSIEIKDLVLAVCDVARIEDGFGKRPKKDFNSPLHIGLEDVISGTVNYCKGHIMPFFPYDIWNVVKSYDGRKMGIKSTSDLFLKDNPILVRRWIGNRPYALTVHKDVNGQKTCPFAYIQNGKTECMISSVRPMVCKLNPLSFVAIVNNGVVSWDYYKKNTICNQSEMTVQEKIRGEHGLIEQMNYNIKAMGLIVSVLRKKVDRQAILELMFNFDAPAEYGKLGDESKIDDFDGLLRANFFVMQMLADAKQQKNQKK